MCYITYKVILHYPVILHINNRKKLSYLYYFLISIGKSKNYRDIDSIELEVLKRFSFIIPGMVFSFLHFQECNWYMIPSSVRKIGDGEKNGIALLEEGSGMPIDYGDNEFMSYLPDI